MATGAKSGERSSGTQVFERILDRESELLAEVKEARQRGREIITQAQKDASQITSDTQDAARDRAAKETEAIKAETQKKIEDLAAQYEQECDDLRAELMHNVDKAVTFVLDLVKAPMLLPMTLQVDKGVSYVIDRVTNGEALTDPPQEAGPSENSSENRGGESHVD